MFDENYYPKGFPTHTFDFAVEITITDPSQYYMIQDYMIQAKLTLSNFKGIAANAGDSLEDDLYFDAEDNSDWTWVDSTTLKCEYNSMNTTLPSSIKVRCRDWGAHGEINVTTTDTDITRHIPIDVNQNDIADGWEKEHGIYESDVAKAQAKAADHDDDEKGPGTNPNHGDGWSVYDEYRGLYTTTDERGNPTGYTRLNPEIKDIMYTSHANVEKYGTGALPGVEMHSFTHVDHNLYQMGFDPFTNIYEYASSGEVGHIDTVDDKIGRVNYNSNPGGKATPVPGARSVWSIRIIDNGDDGTKTIRLGNATAGSPSKYSLATIFTDKIERRIMVGWNTLVGYPNINENDFVDPSPETLRARAKEKLIPIVIGHEVAHCLNIHANCNHLNCIMHHNLRLIFVADGCFLLIKQIENPAFKQLTGVNDPNFATTPEFIDARDAEGKLIPLAGPVLDNSHIGHMAVTGSPGSHNSIEDCSFEIGCVVDEADDSDDEANSGNGNLDGGTTTPTTYLADSSTRTLAPASGSNTYATAGSTHEASLTSSVPYDSVVWQVRTPSNTSHLVPTVETDTGDGTATDASMSYTFPAGVTGTYTIMAYVWYSDLSARAMSYDVRVTLSPGLRPINSSTYYANGGETYEMGLVTDAPFSQVRWYVKEPGDTSTDGTNVKTLSVSGVTITDTELSYTLPTSNPGNYKITAHIYRSDGSDYKVTYNVYVY